MPLTPQDYKGEKILQAPYDENHKPVPPLFLPVVNGSGNIVGYLPPKTTDNLDGTATLSVNTEITAINPNLTIGNVKVVSADGQTSGNRWIRGENDGTIFATVDELDVNLSTVASEATLATRASELTLAGIKSQTDQLTFAATRLLVDGSGVTQPISATALPLPTGAATEATLSTRASQATLASALVELVSINSDLDVALSTRASEASLLSVLTEVTAINADLDVALSTRASQATVASILAQLDVALSTRASEATLATVLTLAGFQARINTLGQKAMAASTPVVIASDQSALAVTDAGAPSSTVAAVARSAASVTLLASNASRRGATVYNDSGVNLFIKLGATATTTTSYTVRVSSQGYFEVPARYTGIIDGIWASGGGGNALVTELT